jgi:FkbM family methyltransferase
MSVNVKERAKGILRRFIPAHVRFTRAGESFLRGGEREVHLLPDLVPAGSVAVDVGAHIGDYTYSLCKSVGPTGHVIAIEPQPDLARRLVVATRRLGLPVTVHHCGLSSKDGEAELFIPREDGRDAIGFATLEHRGGQGKSYRVPLRRLDDLCRDVPGRISFMKVDVEGHELEVFRGGTETLKKHRPTLIVEIEQRHSAVSIGETFNFILSQGYRGEFMDQHGKLIPLTEFDPQTHQNYGPPRSPDYISNFIFRAIMPEGN